ncbi:MAG: aldehyde dehydrogenase family protein, partial [Acidobacteriota bacterium]
MLPEYRPEQLSDFSLEAVCQAQLKALEHVGHSLGTEFPNRIGGRDLRASTTFTSINPSRTDQVVGVFPKQGMKAVEEALGEAEQAFRSWRFTEAEDRAALLLRVAAIMRERRFVLNAWEIYEVGKPWMEADGDVAEAIDFCEFYAREAVRYAGPQPLVPLPGEMTRLAYIPLGVGAIIPPWNFPLAILCGMTTAAIAAGNTVIVKPSSDAAGVASIFMQILIDAGLPPGVVNLVTGPGPEAGEALVTHPRIRFIAFTGSKEVGLRINAEAARPREGQIWIKRSILEMGGKDFTLVDETADLDRAAAGILAGAFGFQGQKCSACSRAILHEKIHDAVLERIVEGAGKIKVGPAMEKGSEMGPVINQAALKKISAYIEIGKKEGRMLTGGEPA